MKPTIKTQVCVIGAGPGGLSVAAGTSQLGMDTFLIEKARMGGDCLNTGCVPSKALLAAAKHAHEQRSNKLPGIAPVNQDINFEAVKDHVRNVIQSIEPNDSQERFEELGVKVLRNEARFLAPNLIQCGNELIQTKYCVIATGSRPIIQPIKGN
jgi:pyruvate/2-oxoglutarate dehydrogenase complex dihydrolipoamide dehydrogenase (E3) component